MFKVQKTAQFACVPAMLNAIVRCEAVSGSQDHINRDKALTLSRDIEKKVQQQGKILLLSKK